jgi:hypothetical protein
LTFSVLFAALVDVNAPAAAATAAVAIDALYLIDMLTPLAG